MRKSLLLLMMAVAVSAASITAQDTKTNQKPNGQKQEKKNEHDTKRITMLNAKLGLNAADSAKFWPVYIQMTDELKASRKSFKSTKSDKKVSEMTDEEVKVVIDNGFAMRQKDLDIRKSYNEKFIALIGVKKVAELYMIERNSNGDHPKKGK